MHDPPSLRRAEFCTSSYRILHRLPGQGCTATSTASALVVVLKRQCRRAYLRTVHPICCWQAFLKMSASLSKASHAPSTNLRNAGLRLSLPKWRGALNGQKASRRVARRQRLTPHRCKVNFCPQAHCKQESTRTHVRRRKPRTLGCRSGHVQ